MFELACTICASPAAENLRAAMLQSGFAWSLVQALSPLFVLSALLGAWNLARGS